MNISMGKYILLLIVAGFLSSCSNHTSKVEDAYTPIDTATSFKINSYWVTPKKSFEFSSMKSYLGDTLHLVTCSQYVYFPFSALTDSTSLKSSLLKNFEVVSYTRDTFTNVNIKPSFFEWRESVSLKLGSDKLNLSLDNDPEASTHGYIQSGEIVDDRVTLANDIKIGMKADGFYGKFFEHFPAELNGKYKVVEFESCVTDVTHIYTFIDGRLGSVKFITQ